MKGSGGIGNTLDILYRRSSVRRVYNSSRKVGEGARVAKDIIKAYCAYTSQ